VFAGKEEEIVVQLSCLKAPYNFFSVAKQHFLLNIAGFNSIIG